MNAVSQSEAPMADEPIGMYPETESTESENETPNLELTDEDSINPDAETSTSSIYEDVTPTVEAPQEKLSETTNTYQEEPIQEPEVEQESRSFDTPEEITEVTEEIQVTETESIDNTETVSDTEDA